MDTTRRVTHTRWDEMPRDAVNATFGRKLVSGEHITIAQVFLAVGGGAPKHQHENEQFSYVVKGTLRFWIGDDEEMLDVRGGEILHILPNVPHRAEAIEEVFAIDVFSPPRMDWVNRTDDYLRQK